MKPGNVVKTKDGHVGRVEIVFPDYVAISTKITTEHRRFYQPEDLEVMAEFSGDVKVLDEDDGYCD